jgi:hypothetical protein
VTLSAATRVLAEEHSEVTDAAPRQGEDQLERRSARVQAEPVASWVGSVITAR